MPNLRRGTTRPATAGHTKLLFVRPPARSVRKSEHDPTPLRLAIGVIVAMGIVVTVWLMGHIGYRLGFAPLMRAPDLVGEPGLGLATGTMMLISMPRVIFQAGLVQPLWLMLGFAMIMLPAAGLGAATPLTPGGPRPKPAIRLIAATGAVLAMISGSALIWWTGSPARTALARALPHDPALALQWQSDLQTVAGLDVLAVIAAALWVVLVMRLPIPIWLRALAASAALFTLVVVTVAMSMSNAASAQIASVRSLCTLEGDRAVPRVIVGTTPQHMVTLAVADGHVVVELRNHPEALAVTDRRSIVDYLHEHRDASRTASTTP